MSEAYELTREEIDAMFNRYRVPAILLMKTATADGPGAPGCYYGGQPTLPPEIEWPWFRSNEYDGAVASDFSVPMQFLMQMDLRCVPRLVDGPKLPESGTLFFFFDQILGPAAGYSNPGDPFVHYYPGDVSGFPERSQPAYTLPSHWDSKHQYQCTPKRWNMTFGFLDTYDSDKFEYENNYGGDGCENAAKYKALNRELLSKIVNYMEGIRSLGPVLSSQDEGSTHHIFGRYGGVLWERKKLRMFVLF